MSEVKWEVVVEVPGGLRVEILRNMLEARGITVFLNQEGAGRAVGLTVGPLGDVQVMVPDYQSQEARQIIDDYFEGRFETDEGNKPVEGGGP